MKRLLLLLPIAALIAAAGGGAPAITQVVGASTSSDIAPTATTPPDLPVLRHRDFGENVTEPAQPAEPAEPAAPATPSTAALGPQPTPNDDPCEGFNNIDARSRCRENDLQRRERDRQRDEQDREEQFDETHGNND